MDDSLAPYGNRVARPPAEPRRVALKRAISATLVVLVHLVFLSVLTLQFLQEQRRPGRKGAVETILDLSLLRNPNAPRITLIKPQVEAAAPPEITTAPITIVPPKPQEQQNAPPAPGDVLKAIGEALACGASNFENLTDAQRAHCRHQPWLARKLPDGTIVLDAPPKQAQAQVHITGADQMRHDIERGPACPLMLQTPCVDDIIHGRDSKPF